jgi:hypothetical protein
MTLTRHAEVRLQQRAIPPFVVDLLESCGSTVRCGGADRLFFDKAAKKRLERHLGGARSLRVVEKYLNVYAVFSDGGSVVTVGHRSKRVNRP